LIVIALIQARTWNQIIARIPNRRAIAFDMRGHGLSAKPEPPYLWHVFGEDTAALARALGLRGATGVGHSMGGHSLALAAAKFYPRQPETIFVLPLKGADFRCPPEAKLRVFRSRTGGALWDALGKGLPQENAFMGVYREGMAMDSLNPAGVYFGTNTGKIFASDNEGDSWRTLADNLPPVYSISTAVV